MVLSRSSKKQIELTIHEFCEGRDDLLRCFLHQPPDPEDIVEEGYDLAIRISRAGSTSNVARKLATSRNIVCASPRYLRKHGIPATPSDLVNHICIGYTYAATGDRWNFTDDKGQVHSVKVSCALHTNNGDTVRSAALAGLGISWNPSFLIGADLRAGRLVRLLPGYRLPDIDVLVLYPSRRHLSAKVRVMIDFLADAFKETPPMGHSLGRHSSAIHACA